MTSHDRSRRNVQIPPSSSCYLLHLLFHKHPVPCSRSTSSQDYRPGTHLSYLCMLCVSHRSCANLYEILWVCLQMHAIQLQWGRHSEHCHDRRRHDYRAACVSQKTLRTSTSAPGKSHFASDSASEMILRRPLHQRAEKCCALQFVKFFPVQQNLNVQVRP